MLGRECPNAWRRVTEYLAESVRMLGGECPNAWRRVFKCLAENDRMLGGECAACSSWQTPLRCANLLVILVKLFSEGDAKFSSGVFSSVCFYHDVQITE
jgi:hypothetical protein